MKRISWEEGHNTDCGKTMGENRYVVWVFKDSQRHIVRVGSDKKQLQRCYGVDDCVVFTFNADHLVKQEDKKQKRHWNYGSREMGNCSRINRGHRYEIERGTRL